MGEAGHSHSGESCLYVSCHEIDTSGESVAEASSQLGETPFKCKLDPGLGNFAPLGYFALNFVGFSC